MFEGSYVALVTPFDSEGRIDEDAYRALIRRQIKGGTKGLVPCGSTGEAATLTHEEFRRAIEIALEESRGDVPVMAGAMNNIPGSFSTLGHRQENLALLKAAGVQVIIVGDGGGLGEDNYNARNVRYEAGNAVAYGMAWDDALKAVTLVPAEVLGVSDRVGSLQIGKEADVVVWSGDPFEFATVAEHVYVRGVENTERTRQDELTDRYKNKPPTYRKP